MDCAKKSLEEAGFKDYQHIRITDLGFLKWQTESTDKSTDKIVDTCSKFFNLINFY